MINALYDLSKNEIGKLNKIKCDFSTKRASYDKKITKQIFRTRTWLYIETDDGKEGTELKCSQRQQGCQVLHASNKENFEGLSSTLH